MDGDGHGRLGWEDTRILRLETAAIKGHTLKLIVCDPPPPGAGPSGPLGLSELRRHVEARLDRAPEARWRLAFPPLGAAGPVWVDDPDFDLDYHVRSRGAGTEVGSGELRALAAEAMSERLDHARPLWRIELVSPLEGGASALLIRIHHCMADGMTSLRLCGELLWNPEPAAEGAPAPWRPAPPPGRGALLASALRDRATGAARGAVAAARATVAPGRWREGARTLARLPGALRRELAPKAEITELDRRLGPRRALGMTTLDMAELRDAAHAAGALFGAHVTLNDMLIAAVAAGLRDWLPRPADDLRVQIPVSMHRGGERAGQLGNRDSFIDVDLPMREPDPVERLRAINVETTDRKEREDAAVIYPFFHALARLGPIGRVATARASGAREFSLSVSNVPGPRDPISIAGRPVRSQHSFAEPADHHTLRVGATSCAGRLHVGICLDPDVLEGPDRLAAAIEQGARELVAAVAAARGAASAQAEAPAP